ncbi:MAG: mechanosensitive ion channel family protein, partial [Candidatus Latescibacterota bacterium]
NDNWVEFILRYVVDYKQRRGTKDQIFTRLLEEIKQSGGRVQIATTSFRVTSVPDVNVSVKREGQEVWR